MPSGLNLAQRLTSSVSIPLGGKLWPVIFSHSALLDVELSTGLDILSGEYKILTLSAKALRATVHTLLAVSVMPSPAPYTEPEVGGLIQFKVLGKVRGAVVEAWRAAMPEAEPEDEHAAKSTKTKRPKPKLTWLEVWANNRETLNLTDDQWLAYTPRMVQQLARERLEVDRRWELMISRVATVGVNFSMCHPKQPLADGHFMLHPYPKQKSSGGGDILTALSGLGGLFPLAEKLAKEKANNERSKT